MVEVTGSNPVEITKIKTYIARWRSWYLSGLITQRSLVRVQPALLKNENMLTKSDIEKIIDLGKKFPNNQDLGKHARSEIKDDFFASKPNDFDLGNALRKIILDISRQD